MPTNLEGHVVDDWGHALRVRENRLAPGWIIASDGPDGIAGTSDDLEWSTHAQAVMDAGGPDRWEEQQRRDQAAEAASIGR